MPISPALTLDFGPRFRQCCHKDKRHYRFYIIFRLPRGIPTPADCFPHFLMSVCRIQVAMGDVKKDEMTLLQQEETDMY